MNKMRKLFIKGVLVIGIFFLMFSESFAGDVKPGKLTPHGIIAELKLRESDGTRYRQTASYGHFGREGDAFTWEKTDRVKELKKYIK